MSQLIADTRLSVQIFTQPLPQKTALHTNESGFQVFARDIDLEEANGFVNFHRAHRCEEVIEFNGND